MNGAVTTEANMIQLELRSEEFDRRIRVENPPELSVFFSTLNQVLARLRTATRSSLIKPVASLGTVWYIRYLNDDGSELERAEGFQRGRFATSFSVGAIGITAETWDTAQTLPESLVLRTWEALILDAQAALPEEGPAIVLAASSLETFITYTLNALASRLQPPLPNGLWDWINDRDDFRKEPSVEERFDFLLKIVSGKSLKEEKALWEAFKEIKSVRNKFVHEGRAATAGNIIDSQKAAELVGHALQIITWVEKLLPTELQRKPMRSTEFQFTLPPLL